MTPQEAVNRLRPALAQEGSRTFRFACPRVFLMLKLFGASDRLRFTSKDHVVFQIGEHDFVIVDSKTGLTRALFGWKEIECMVAGEPETDNGVLFQG